MVSYEPELKMYKILNERFKSQNVKIKNLLISDKQGKLNFLSIRNNEAYSSLLYKSVNSLNIKKKNIIIKKKKSSTLNKEIEKYGYPDYIKIDCEGAEKLILIPLKYKVKIISFELNLPFFFNEGISIINEMKKKFNSKFNLRIQDKNKFEFKNNINEIEIINYLKNKKITVEIFIFS